MQQKVVILVVGCLKPTPLNPSMPKISLVIPLLLTVCHTILMMRALRIWHWVNNKILKLFLYSHHLSDWCCIGIERRNSVLVTYGSYRVKRGKNYFQNFSIFPCFSLVFNWPMLKRVQMFPCTDSVDCDLSEQINFFSLQLMAHDLIAALDEMYENKKFSKVWQMSSLINQRFSSLYKIQCTIYKFMTMLMIHLASCCVVLCTVSLAFHV